MVTNITINLNGNLAIHFDDRGNASVQFLPDEEDSIFLDSTLLEGSAQLLRNGQFEFVSNKFNNLKIN